MDIVKDENSLGEFRKKFVNIYEYISDWEKIFPLAISRGDAEMAFQMALFLETLSALGDELDIAISQALSSKAYSIALSGSIETVRVSKDVAEKVTAGTLSYEEGHARVSTVMDSIVLQLKELQRMEEK